MSYTLADKIKNLTPYDPITSHYRIRLDANESFLPANDAICADLREWLVKLDFNRYPDPYAVRLCEAFGRYYGVHPDYVTAGNGSDELISILIGSFLHKNDRILTFSPDFSMYRFYSELMEDRVEVLEKDADMRIDLDQAAAVIRERQIRAVIFSNPCNPTSLGISADAVRRFVRSTDALVILDEAYMDFWDQANESLLCEAAAYDNLVILRTCSKAIGMASVRLGFAVAGPVLTRAIRAAKSPYNVNSMTQAVGEVIFSHPDTLREALRLIKASRDELYAAICALAEKHPQLERVYPTVTNFVYLRTQDAKELDQMLRDRSIAIRRMGEHLRITAGTKEENQALLQAFSEILQQNGKGCD